MAELRMERAGEALVLMLSGDWRLTNPLPSSAAVEGEIDTTRETPGRLTFDTTGLRGWDSALLTFLLDVIRVCVKKHVRVEKEGLPQGVQRLLNLASAVSEAKGARKQDVHLPLLARLGDRAVSAGGSVLETVGFIGEVAASMARMIVGKARFRKADLWLTLGESGSQALPIVSLISLLVGLILAFVGSIQLKLFGAQIYVADLVGIAMVRAMGAIMAGIIMAGRTGASFAAQIGTMQVNEEIDALKTAGIHPIDFLVLPRVVALALMMPLLTIYADLMGILGGLVVGVVGLNLNVMQYYNETKNAVTLTNLWIGLFSGLVFGILIAVAGCLRGMQCGRSASAVGDATRSAVVTSIVSIIVATAIITVVCDVLGI
ncbi:MAG: putative phospholipid ABC transporter permease protein MlaE [Syntrophorhabdaceae bacterium PtaU1.Bin034]|nr:MAG: putative phospholipid ABC transporter permease protein MlaE [Syntrophorhabdaceae bacterium PtaU1.Bin034]